VPTICGVAHLGKDVISTVEESAGSLHFVLASAITYGHNNDVPMDMTVKADMDRDL
jgi:hypothetical protein